MDSFIPWRVKKNISSWIYLILRGMVCIVVQFGLQRNMVAHHQSPVPGDGEKALVVRLASACVQIQLCVPCLTNCRSA